MTELLQEKLFDKIPIIATSATLAVGGDFSFFRSRVGLTDAREVVLPLAFDYESNALLYLPRMRTEPAYGAASGPYLDELAEEMSELIAASRGRAFLLFSSQNALRGVLERMGERFDGADYSFLVQGQDLTRGELLRQFRQRSRAVLFGLKSFWEGVDVVGESLSLVVIDKLPFDPPDDPVNEARVNRMKQAGENWFGGDRCRWRPAAEAGHRAAAAHERRPRGDGDPRQAAVYQELRREMFARCPPPAHRDIADVAASSTSKRIRSPRIDRNDSVTPTVYSR